MTALRRALKLSLLAFVLYALAWCALLSMAVETARADGTVSVSQRYQDGDTMVPTWQTWHASWYGWDFAGSRMADGGYFDPTDPHIAAHRSLSFGTKLVVCNEDYSRCLACVVRDRGPYNYSRDIDLSEAAFAQLYPLGQGVGVVHVYVVGG